MKTNISLKIAIPVVVSFLGLLTPRNAAAQGVSIQGAAGATINVGANTQAVSVGFPVGRRVEFVVSGERIHMPTEVTEFENGMSATRGGTSLFASGEVRVHPLGFDRVSPYALVGAGAGVSRPNVNDLFPDRVTNSAKLLFFGGGVRVPVTERVSVFGDLRFGLQIENGDSDGVFLFVPIRGGVAFRF